MKKLNLQTQERVVEKNIRIYMERELRHFPEPSKVKIPIFAGHKLAKELKEKYLKKGWGIKEKGNLTYLLFIPEK